MKRVMVLFGALLLLGTMTAFAQEAAEPAAEAKDAPAATEAKDAPAAEANDEAEAQEDNVKRSFEEYADLNAGVDVKYDEKGNFRSIIVTGSSRVSTVLGKARGKETARQKAELRCAEAFVRWSDGHLSVEESESKEVILTVKGDGKTVKEEGAQTESHQKKVEFYASNIVRGLRTLAVDEKEDEDGLTITVVKGLKPQDIDQINKLMKKLQTTEVPKSKSGQKAKPKDKTQKRKTSVAPGAEDFL